MFAIQKIKIADLVVEPAVFVRRVVCVAVIMARAVRVALVVLGRI